MPVNNIKGYHTNYANKCRKFIETDEIIISEDENFLGRGMYFWDVESNAAYWKTVKERQKPDESVVTVSADIITETFLDTMDENVRVNIGLLWKNYNEKKKSSHYRKNKIVTLGQVLDTLPIIKDIPVRRGIYYYENNRISDFASYGITITGIKSCKLSNDVKVIYAVIDKKCAINREYKE